MLKSIASPPNNRPSKNGFKFDFELANTGRPVRRQRRSAGLCGVNCFSARKAAKAKAIAEGLISASIFFYQRAQKFNFASLSRKNKRAETDRCVLIFAYFLSRKSRKERLLRKTSYHAQPYPSRLFGNPLRESPLDRVFALCQDRKNGRKVVTLCFQAACAWKVCCPDPGRASGHDQGKCAVHSRNYRDEPACGKQGLAKKAESIGQCYYPPLAHHAKRPLKNLQNYPIRVSKHRRSSRWQSQKINPGYPTLKSTASPHSNRPSKNGLAIKIRGSKHRRSARRKRRNAKLGQLVN